MISLKHKSLLNPRCYIRHGKFASVLHRMNQSGVLAWRTDMVRTTKLSHHAKTHAMAMFMLAEDDNCGRLISWPRIPNDCFVDAPDPCFPELSHFAGTTLNCKEVQQGIYMHVLNMFHNLIFPRRLHDLFLLPAICLKELLIEIHKSLSILIRDPIDAEDLVMTGQETAPMCFTWSMKIARDTTLNILMALNAVMLSSNKCFRL